VSKIGWAETAQHSHIQIVGPNRKLLSATLGGDLLDYTIYQWDRFSSKADKFFLEADPRLFADANVLKPGSFATGLSWSLGCSRRLPELLAI
jgi:hypothetical protein